MKIIYVMPDGHLEVNSPGELSVSEVIAKDIPREATSITIISKSKVPQDRNFRDAWEHGGDHVKVNMDKARNIHLDRIRAVRNAKLSELDVETIKAMGKQDTKALAEVEAQKQVLRDIPQTLDLSKAQTPEELKALWPVELE